MFYALSILLLAVSFTVQLPTTGERVDGYRAYYGTASGDYTDNVTLQETARDSTKVTLTGDVPIDQTYYVALRAYNPTGESADSNEVVLGKPSAPVVIDWSYE